MKARRLEAILLILTTLFLFLSACEKKKSSDDSEQNLDKHMLTLGEMLDHPIANICHQENMPFDRRGNGSCYEGATLSTSYECTLSGVVKVLSEYTKDATVVILAKDEQGWILDQCGEFPDGRPIIFFFGYIPNLAGHGPELAVEIITPDIE